LKKNRTSKQIDYTTVDLGDYLHKAIDLDPKQAQAHGGLRSALSAAGKFTAAKQNCAQAMSLLPEGSALRKLTQQHIQDCEERQGIDQEVTAILKGDAQAGTPAHQLELARFRQQATGDYTLTIRQFSTKPEHQK
jgi:hypothetical protein